LKIIETVEKEYEGGKCFPEKENIFRIFKEISLEKIKVVILGQDPYHIPGVADGLAFSTKKPNFIPASLRNIFLEMNSDLGIKIPKKGDLIG
jgi:uracil-DNA glycosylase